MIKRNMISKSRSLGLTIATIVFAFFIISVIGTVGTAEAAKKPTATSFHDTWRQLWVDHITWTRMVIIGIIDNVPGTTEAETRLLKNYGDMEDVLKPYFGDDAEQLGDLIQDHLLIAVAILEAAKAGDVTTLNQKVAEWYANGDTIATKKNEMNPKFWKLNEAKEMWKDHLDATLEEATARLTKDYAADVIAYDKVSQLALGMADFFSRGVIKKFPSKFTGKEAIK